MKKQNTVVPGFGSSARGRAIGLARAAGLRLSRGGVGRAGKGAAGGAMVEALEARQMLAVVVRPGMDLPNQTFSQNGGAIVVDLAGRYDDTGITGTLVRFTTTSGSIDLELFDQAGAARARTTPLTVTNFLNYLDAGDYQNTVFHRSVPGFVIQAGGFRLPTQNNTAPSAIPTDPPVQNEPGNTNIRGTIAMAKLGNNPNSATNQWFFNLNNNAANLDNQNGGFTAFGRIINGLEVADAIAALRIFDFGGTFNELPVQESYNQQVITPNDFVNVSSIARNSANRTAVVDQSLRFTVTSSNPALAQAYLYNGRLIVSPGANQTGTASVTVRATAVDGTFTDDVFTVTVNATQALQQVQGTPLPVLRLGDNVTLTPGGSGFEAGTVSTVEYFLDSNRNGAFDAGTDAALGSGNPGAAFVTATTNFQVGTNLVFARGVLTAGGNTAATATPVVVNAAPTIASVAVNPTVVTTPGANITLTANTVADSDGTVTRVQFYRDADGNGMLDTAVDTLLGEDTSATGGYTLTVATTGFTTGTTLNRIFAIATDNNTVTSVPVSTTVRVNTPPVIGSLATNGPVNRPAQITITASDVTDDTNVSRVEFFRDVNGNGTFEAGTDVSLGTDTTISMGAFSITVATTNFPAGNVTIFARAQDENNATSVIATVVAVVNNAAPTVASLSRSPDPVVRLGNNLTLTANGVADADGTVARVDFYRDANGNDAYDPGVDTLIGSDNSAQGGFTLTIATTAQNGFAPGTLRYFAVPVDNDGASAAVPASVFARINALPVVGTLVANPNVIPRGSQFTLSASNVTDADGNIVRVEFYRDSNGNGTLEVGTDTLLGSDTTATNGVYTFTGSSASLGGLSATFLARAVDDDTGAGEVTTATATIVNAAPTVASLTRTPDPLAQVGAPVTLTANGVADADGVVQLVEFYLDNGTTPGVIDDQDTLLGSDNTVAGGFRLTVNSTGFVVGNNTVLARATDADGAFSNVVSAVVRVNNTPTVATLAVGPGNVPRRANVTLTATGVTDSDGGTIARVEFFRDANNNGTFEAGTDVRLGVDTSATAGAYTLTVATTAFPAGTVTVFARAQDNNGGLGAAASTTVVVTNNTPTVGTLTGTPAPLVAVGAPVTLAVASATDVDGTIASVQFYLDDGLTPGQIDPADTLLGADGLAAGGYRITVNSTAFGVGQNTVLARAVDNDGAFSQTVSAVVRVNAAPTVATLTPAAGTVARLSSVLLTAGGVADTDGTVRKVEFFRDVNGNGVLDVGVDRLLGSDSSAAGGYTFLASTAGFATGTNTLFARAVDNNTGAGAVATTTITVTNVLPTITSATVRSSPTPFLGQNITITTAAARDTDGGVSTVLFFRESNGVPGLQPAAEGMVDADTAIGEDNSAVGGYTLTVATLGSLGFAVGSNTVYSCVVDTDGGNNFVSTTFTIGAANAGPVVGTFTAPGGSVARLTAIALSAEAVTDADGTVRAVEFYRDRNGNGRVDVGIDLLLGTDTTATGGVYTINAPTLLFATGANTVLARAQDNRLAFGEAVAQTVTITNVVPQITGLTVRPSPITGLNAPVTLTAVNPRDPDGVVSTVLFFTETNGVPGFQPAPDQLTPADTLLGEDTNPSGGFTLTVPASVANGFVEGTNILYACVIDNEGANDFVALTVTVNAAPVIASIQANPDPISRAGVVTLRAVNVADPNGDTIRSVGFFLDSNGNGLLDATDRSLGNGTRNLTDYVRVLSGSTFTAAGTVRIFARATDSRGAVSVSSAQFTVI